MKKRMLALLLVMTMLISAFTVGCSSNKSSKEESSTDTGTGKTATKGLDTSEKVDLVMYLVGSEKANHDKIMEQLNAKLEKDLNCTLTLKYIGFGEFDTKYPLVLSSGEQIDLIYTAAWLNYSQLAQKGAFMAIEDILPTCAPKSYAETDIDTLKSMDADGHIYCLPANHPTYYSYGTIVRADVMKQLGYSEIKSLDDYVNFCIDVNKNTTYKDSTCQSMHFLDEMYLVAQGYYPLSGGTSSPYWTKVSDPAHKVYHKSEIAELQSFLQKAQERCNAGAWSQSALSNTDSQMVLEGLSASTIHNVDTWVSNATQHPEYQLTYTNISNPIYEGTFIQDCMAVPASAKYPERALAMLELFRQDESYYNLITYGIEGENYEIQDDGTIKLMNQDGYQYENGTWGFRDDKFYRELAGSPSNTVEVKKAIKDNAKENIFKSFVLDTSKIKNEYAAVQNATSQYYDPLALGYTDYKSGLEQLNSALKSAGNDTCKEQLQAQVDAFVAKVQK